MADVTAPSVIWMVTQRSSFVLRDIESLGTIVADAIASQLAPWLYESVRELLPEDDGRVFFDELDGVLVLDSYGPLDISIRAPFTSLTASFAATTVTPYDSTEGGSLVEWLTDLAKNLPPKED
jgi:hypothetical protein